MVLVLYNLQERVEKAVELGKITAEEGADLIEKITLSFALSIAVVPLTIFYLNKIGMKINTINSILTIIGIIIIVFIMRKLIKSKNLKKPQKIA